MGSLQSALRAAALVPDTAPAPTVDVPVVERDDDSFDEATLRWCSVVERVVGRAALDRAAGRAEADWGTGAGRSAWERPIERAFDALPSAEAAALRDEAGRGPWRGKGCPTFFADLTEVLACLRSGAHLRWAAEQRRLSAACEVPQPAEDEDPQGYDDRLREWEGAQTAAALRAVGFDRRRAVQAYRDRLEKAERLARERAAAEAERAFLAGGDFAAYKAAVADAPYRAGASARCWELVLSGALSVEYAAVPPPPEVLALPVGRLFALWASTSTYSSEACQRVRATLVAVVRTALPSPKEGEIAVFKATLAAVGGRYVHADRGAHECAIAPIDGGFVLVEGAQIDGDLAVLPATPHPTGWVGIKPATKFDRAEARWFGPRAYAAIEAGRRETGRLDVRAWLPRFGRHPERGFGRFFFAAVAGAASRGSCMVSVDDALRARIELMADLPPEDFCPLPAGAFCISATVTRTDAGKGHLRAAHNGIAGVTCVRESSGYQGSRRYIGGTEGVADTSRAPWWSASGHSAKHSAVVIAAIVSEGRPLHLSSGIGVELRDSKLVDVPGGALPPSA